VRTATTTTIGGREEQRGKGPKPLGRWRGERGWPILLQESKQAGRRNRGQTGSKRAYGQADKPLPIGRRMYTLRTHMLHARPHAAAHDHTRRARRSLAGGGGGLAWPFRSARALILRGLRCASLRGQRESQKGTDSTGGDRRGGRSHLGLVAGRGGRPLLKGG